MKHILFVGSFVCIVLLILGSVFYPSSALMQLAGNSVALNLFRAACAGFIVTVLFTKPPRRAFVRVLMGLLAAGLVIASIKLFAGYSMHILDALLYLELGCALAEEALEIPEPTYAHSAALAK